MTFSHARRRITGIAVATLLAACGDDPLGPADLQDPVALQGELAAVDSAFASEAFSSFGAVASYLGPTPVAAATPLLLAAPAPLAASAQRAARLRQLAPQLSGSPNLGPIVHDSLYGRVYRWDEAANQYAWNGSETVTGLTGVRFMLYRVDEFGVVQEPVVEVGYVDLIDESSGTTARLRIRVSDSDGDPIYVNYLATFTETATATATITATGSITNGLPAAANKTLTFDVTIRVNASSATLAATFALNSPAITIDLNETVTFSQTEIVVSIDFRIIRAAEIVRLLGRMTFSNAGTVVDMEVRVNGGVVARIDGDPTTAQWVDAGGAPLGPEDLEALGALFQALAEFDEVLGELLEPISVIGTAA